MDSLIRAGGLQGYEGLMKKLGQDPTPLLKKHGISRKALSDVDELISLYKATGLLEDSAAVCQTPTFGLQLASEQDNTLLGAVSEIIQTAPTIKHAIRSATQYLFLHSPAMEFAFKPTSDVYSNCVTLSLTMHQSQYATQIQAIDAALGYMWRFSQVLTQKPLPLKGVSLPHTPQASENHYRRFFGAPVHFEQPYAGLHFPQEAMLLSLQPSSPKPSQLAQEHIAITGRNILTTSEQVRRAITRTLGEQRATKNVIAEMLAMHPRTLQRRLSAENDSFEQIQENVYKETALRFLTETNIPLMRLADILGFNNQSAFARSAKRWFGKAPSVVRKEST